MAQLKKNQLGQVLFILVDSTDYATVESALTNPPTAKFYGVNHGTSAAATSGAISKIISHVHSGIYRLILKASETNYDYVLYNIKQPSCADQNLVFQPVDNDDSDLLSALTVIQSMASDAASAAQQANSRILIVQSQASDLYSMLSDHHSEFLSRVTKAVATNSQLSDLHSDLRSYLVGLSATISDIYSLVSDANSDLASKITAAISASDLSDIASAVWAAKYTANSAASSFGSLMSDVYSRIVVIQSAASDAASAAQQTNSRVLLNQSRISDAYSMLSDFYSDFQSRVPKAVATNSQLSDLHSDLRSYLVIMSGVQSDIYSLLSDSYSDIQSRLSRLQEVEILRRNTAQAGAASTITLDASASATNDFYTGATINLVSGTGSGQAVRTITAYNGTTKVATVYPAWTTNPDVTTVFVIRGELGLTDSFMSDIASQVWGHAIGTRVDSRILLNLSRISDTYSLLSDFQSDFQSRVPKAVATNSQLSDLHSDLRSYLIGLSATLSDVYSELSDTHSDLASKIAGITASVSASDISDIASAVWAAKYTVHSAASSFGSLMSDVYSRIVLIQSSASDAASAAQQANSRVLLNQSRISDVYSLLSDVNSDLRSLLTTTGVTLDASTFSDIRSAIAAGPAATVTASDISDIASAVWANTIGARVDSRVLLNLSRISDVYSLLSDLNSHVVTTGVPLDASTISDIRSAIAAGPAATVTASDISDIASAVWANAIGARVDSRILVNQSRISDTYSMLSDFFSDFQSRVPKAVATNSQLSDLHSDLRSYLVVMSGVLSDVYSLLSDHHSDIRSLITTTGVTLDASTFSDIRSAITAGGGATISASDISDIASAVWAAKYTTHSAASSFGSLLSDIYSRIVLVQSSASDAASAAQQTNSRVLLNQSRISDVYSMLSDFYSDFQSRVPGAITPSDVASKVWAEKYTAASNVKASSFGSLIRKEASGVSDTYSMLSDFYSDFQSRVPKRVATDSQLSDLHSDLKSYMVGLSGQISDVESQLDATDATLSDFKSDFQSRVPKVVATNSQLSDLHSDLRSYLVVMSGVLSDTYSAVSDFQSDFQSRVPKRVATDSQLSNLHSDLSARIPATLSSGRMRVDVEAISASTTAATNFKQSLLSTVTGSAVSGTLSTTQMSTDLTETTTDHYAGRLITFITGTLAGQQSEVTAYNGSTKVLTFTALTEAAVAGDQFILT